MAQIPSWYKPNTQGETGFLTLQNALLPYLNEQGQIEGTANLRTGDDTFKDYDPSSIRPPSSLSSDRRKMYLSRERAERALAAIARMQSATGEPLSKNPSTKQVLRYDAAGNPVYASVTPDSAGLRFLTDSIKQMKQYGASGGAMSRRDYLNFLDATKAMQSSQAASDAGDFYQLARQFTNVEGSKPTSSVGGRTIFGKASSKLFG